MASVDEIVAAYMAAWNETDEAKRRSLLEMSWADDGTYTDPQSDVAGREALTALIGGMHGQMPGARIDVTSKTDLHHDKLRFAWKFVGADGSMTIEGIDFGELAEDGRLKKIVGFWGQPPAL
ncbi:MAG: nuclear transport factor 2 family protein [Dehalococcoidia bacterium]|nr:nuclear transport factor 2 family protein [Dehalococcoidia bacterium]